MPVELDHNLVLLGDLAPKRHIQKPARNALQRVRGSSSRICFGLVSYWGPKGELCGHSL